MLNDEQIPYIYLETSILANFINNFVFIHKDIKYCLNLPPTPYLGIIDANIYNKTIRYVSKLKISWKY